MNRTLFASLRTLLAHPDCSDRDALFAVLDDTQAARVLACLAPPGSLAQIAAALRSEWSWDGDGWDRQTDGLVGIITDPRCSVTKQMIETWSSIPNAVGVLRDRTNDLVTWAQQRLDPDEYDDLAILFGPSNASARLLVQSPSSDDIGKTLRRWSMGIDPDNPTTWQAMIDADLRQPLRQKARPSQAFPAWGWDDAVDADVVLDKIVDDVFDGWSPDHPSLRGRIAWSEHHVTPDLHVGVLALVASIGRSDMLAKTVCACLGHDPSSILLIAEYVPWSRLYPRIQTVIDETMQQASDYWERTWACAIGQAPLVPDNDIDETLLLWRIDRERREALDSALRADLLSSICLPDHCYGWGVHPDLVGEWGVRDEGDFRFWNPDVPADDLRAWAYADLLWEQRDCQESQKMIALLDILPQNRRMRFEQIIDWRLGSRSEPTVQPPWEWTVWAALPVIDRQRRLRDRLAVLRGDRDTFPAVRCWRVRNDGLATLALRASDVLGLDDPSPILAAILAQVPALRVHMPNHRTTLPFPDDLDAALRMQIERLPLDRDAQAYAAWCLRFFDQDMGVGSTLIALHPTVAVALAPFLSPAQQKAVAASPAAQGWESVTFLSWVAACAPAQELPPPPRQRRL